MHMANVTGACEKYLFRAIVNTKNGQRLRESGGFSYTRMRELALEKLSTIGLDPKRLCLHSLCSGGASAAANAGVRDRMFKRHGRWRSENAKDGYVIDSLLRPVKDWDQLNFTVFTMCCKHSYSKMKSNEVM